MSLAKVWEVRTVSWSVIARVVSTPTVVLPAVVLSVSSVHRRLKTTLAAWLVAGEKNSE